MQKRGLVMIAPRLMIALRQNIFAKPVEPRARIIGKLIRPFRMMADHHIDNRRGLSQKPQLGSQSGVVTNHQWRGLVQIQKNWKLR
jgi:hypothetical protein